MSDRPGETGDGPGRKDGAFAGDTDLDRRRRDLDAAIAARRPEKAGGAEGTKSGGMAGFGNALKLSSEFIAGILVGAGLGWAIDWYAGTSPFGLIVFLLLGFCAGVLNALRSAGLVSEFGQRTSKDDAGPEK